MAEDFQTPGVYLVEKNAFPDSAVGVETAIPVFIGYTERAETIKGINLNFKPRRISSFAEYVENFGGQFNPVFTVTPVTEVKGKKDPPAEGILAGPSSPSAVYAYMDATNKELSFDIRFKENNLLYTYNAVRLFFLNGGSQCYIMSVKSYMGLPNIEVKKDDYCLDNMDVFERLKTEMEPTIVVIPDAIAQGETAYMNFYERALQHCNETQSRIAIFDIMQSDFDQYAPGDIEGFRLHLSSTSLKYGAAYYPWLNTTLYTTGDVDFENINDYTTVISKFPEFTNSTDPKIAANNARILDALKIYTDDNPADHLLDTADQAVRTEKKIAVHEMLKAASPTYVNLLGKILALKNIMPPSGAIAGIYASTDSDRGVWKAPANVSVNAVISPTVNISNEQQQHLNVDALSGKSINVIRLFPSIGTLVWGARTLDGNSQDWKYINVRRTIIYIEQSLKLATRNFVFEPNTSNTWVVVSSMFNNFLNNLWMQGALAGAVPEQAFEVQLGLGTTMTPNDILDGIMRVSVKLAIVRPEEFIVITFQQQQQQS